MSVNLTVNTGSNDVVPALMNKILDLEKIIIK